MTLKPSKTALLVIDVQDTHLAGSGRSSPAGKELASHDGWAPFHDRMHHRVTLRTAARPTGFRMTGIKCVLTRMATRSRDGRERSLSQEMPG